jgi:hypothetical protein
MPTLEQFAADLAEHIAYSRGWTIGEAAIWVAVRLIEARKEYRAQGAPLGDSDEGFVAWLTPRQQPPTV